MAGSPACCSDARGRFRFFRALARYQDGVLEILARRGERGIWQRRYWEHTIRDDRDYAAHMDYIHFNPIKHGLVDNPADWPFSSFRRCVASGRYPADCSVAALNRPKPESGDDRSGGMRCAFPPYAS